MKDLKHLYEFEKLLQDANNDLVQKAKADGFQENHPPGAAAAGQRSQQGGKHHHGKQGRQHAFRKNRRRVHRRSHALPAKKKRQARAAEDHPPDHGFSFQIWKNEYIKYYITKK